MLDIENKSYVKKNRCEYQIKAYEMVSIGNTSITMQTSIPQPFEGYDKDSAGIFFNREFAVEIEEYNAGAIDPKFDNNKALRREITESELELVIEKHNELNKYNLITNNCAYVATKAWNCCLSTEDKNKYVLGERDYFGTWYTEYVDTPLELHTVLSTKVGSHYFDMWKAIDLE